MLQGTVSNTDFLAICVCFSSLSLPSQAKKANHDIPTTLNLKSKNKWIEKEKGDG